MNCVVTMLFLCFVVEKSNILFSADQIIIIFFDPSSINLFFNLKRKHNLDFYWFIIIDFLSTERENQKKKMVVEDVVSKIWESISVHIVLYRILHKISLVDSFKWL